MSEDNTSAVRLAEEAFHGLNRAGREELLRSWESKSERHTKTATETDDEDKRRYFENMAKPYKEAADHLRKLEKDSN